jgi:integrase/recombinase XerD
MGGSLSFILFETQPISAAIPLIKSEQKMIPSFSKQQALELLNQPNRNTFVGLRDYTVMMVLLETGIRIQELLSLQIQDVVFSENELRVLVQKNQDPQYVVFK